MGLVPFTHAVIDGVGNPRLLEKLARQWPSKGWLGWVGYDPAIEGKMASDLSTPLPPQAGSLLALLASMDLGQLVLRLNTVADLSLHGGGLHEVLPGGHLGCHLDASHHPRLGLARAWSAVLWVHTRWEPEWGGELVLHDSGRQPVVSIDPLPGRLAVFATTPTSWHSVNRVSGPQPRRSLALFGYRDCPGNVTRPRSLFAAAPGEDDGPRAEAARKARSR
jgi:hypothetical protein